MADIFNLTDTWNNGATAFTGIKLNVTDTASDGASKLLDLQVGGTSKVSVSKTGNLDVLSSGAGTCRLGGGDFQYLDASNNRKFLMGSNATGVRLTSDYSFSWSADLGDAYFNIDIGLSRNAAGVLEVNSGSSGTYRDLRARNVRTNPVTVATLTAAATAGAGARSFVTDASAPTFGATVAGGGAVATPVYSDGTNWKVG